MGFRSKDNLNRSIVKFQEEQFIFIKFIKINILKSGAKLKILFEKSKSFFWLESFRKTWNLFLKMFPSEI